MRFNPFTRLRQFKITVQHLLFCSFFALFSSITFAQVSAVNVTISITEPAHHLANINLVFPSSTDNYIDVKLPTWRTGNYAILNLSNGIRNFSAVSTAKSPLKWHKIDKSTWRVETPKKGAISVSYQVYANQLGKRTRHIDDSHAFLDASTVVMYSDAVRELPFVVTLKVPSKWRSISGLKSGTSNHQFLADNYDQLVDSPIETGINELHNFTVDGRKYSLVIWGKGNYDAKQMVSDLSKIVKQASNIWSGYPFSRYVFMVHATSGERGATEHVNSTIIQRSRYLFSDRKDYLGFLSTAAHEFVHTWNVKQYRPEGLAKYDYQQENYTNLLWMSEGSTSYFQSQLLLTAGLMTTNEYFKELAKRINRFNHKPGRQSQSVAESSFDHWSEQGGDYDNNYSVNIYSEGFLVSWLLDFDILATTNGVKSYRDVHHDLYDDYRLPHGFNEKDVLTILKKQTNKDYASWWQKNVHGHPMPDFSSLLAQVGLEMIYGQNNKKTAWSGLSVTKTTDGIKVTRVERNSPAWNAGLAVDDIIVAIDGLRLQNADIAKRLANFKTNDKITITYFRRDQLTKTQLTLTPKHKGKLQIVPMKNATQKQKSQFKSWLGIDYPESQK